jgi:hypothetical protein
MGGNEVLGAALMGPLIFVIFGLCVTNHLINLNIKLYRAVSHQTYHEGKEALSKLIRFFVIITVIALIFSFNIAYFGKYLVEFIIIFALI